MAGQGESEQGREEVIGYWFIVNREEIQPHHFQPSCRAGSLGEGGSAFPPSLPQCHNPLGKFFPIDGGRLITPTETHGFIGFVIGKSHGLDHMTGRIAAGGAGRSIRKGCQVFQCHNQGL